MIFKVFAKSDINPVRLYIVRKLDRIRISSHSDNVIKLKLGQRFLIFQFKITAGNIHIAIPVVQRNVVFSWPDMIGNIPNDWSV